jgi:CrcB protein
MLHLLNSWFYSSLTSKVVLLAVGGAIGTNARYWLAHWVGEVAWARGFPLGTFLINISGSFVLGVIATLLMPRLSPASQNWSLFLGAGFCGGYTTFSTFEWETFRLVRDKALWMALANICGSVLVGFLGVLLAVTLTGLFFPKQ